MKIILKLFSLCLATAVLAAPAQPGLQALNPGSVKENAGDKRRGISFNNPAYTKLFDYGGHKTTWIYNWDSTVEGAEGPFEFIPMLWSDAKYHTDRWFKNVDKYTKMGPGTTHVLSFNEPDQCGKGGACMTDVGATVAAHKQWVEPLRKYGDKILLGSPAVTDGQSKGGLFKGLEYLQQFLRGCNDCKIDFVCIHWYNQATNAAYFKRHIEDTRKVAGGRPIWITEFGVEGTEDEIREFLKDVLPWLDSQPDVHRYAMQWAAKDALVKSDESGLTAIGHLFNTL